MASKGGRHEQPLRAQVELIMRNLEGVGIDPPNWLEVGGDLNYLYREGSILVRDADLPRVRQLVPGQTGDSMINGVTRYLPKMAALDALDRIDDAFGEGVGVAAPDHVIGICPHSICPATEPELPDGGEPEPGISEEEHCDGAGTLVSVVDTGWLDGADGMHPTWLADVQGDAEAPVAVSPIGPYVGHGTFVAGVVRCMAPRADVFVERLPVHRCGAWFESDMIRQLDDAISKSPDVISLSAGTNSRKDIALLGFEIFYESRLRHQKGTVLVAAAGNDGVRRAFWPAAFPWAISVGALSEDGTRRAAFSNYGSWVDVYAPGEGLVNAFAEGDYTYYEPANVARGTVHFDGMARWSGTSFSTPLVSGLIAARMSANGVSARTAADALLRIAEANAVRGIGPILRPGMACAEDPSCECCRRRD